MLKYKGVFSVSSINKNGFLQKRIARIFIVEILFSFICVCIAKFGLVENDFKSYFNLNLFFQALKIVVLWKISTRKIYRSHRITKSFRANIIAYSVVTVVVLLMAIFNFEPIYTYMFFMFKLFHYGGYNRFVSALFVSLYNYSVVMFICMVHTNIINYNR